METLSDQIQYHGNGITKYYPEEAVKSFIEQLKEEFNEANINQPIVDEIIDKLAGDKLI